MNKKQGLFADSENYRAKVESKELCDLGCTIEEKYGPSRGWKLSLRMSDSSKKDQKKQDNLSDDEFYQATDENY